MACKVCVSDYTKLIRKKIECPYCEYDVCSTCVQTYLLSTPETPHCMNCHKSWSKHFMVSLLTSKFVNDAYKKHRENVLFELERSLMPTTQDEVQRVLTSRRITKQISEKQSELMKMLINRTSIVPLTYEQKEFECDLRRQEFDLSMQIELLEFSQHSAPQCKKERKQFIRACPADSCKGFLSTAWKCGICDVYTCHECHEIKGIDHTCIPENVATAKLLSSDSKPCPSCAALIFKIDGCDQMFCTSCHTAFSWKTGRIETGRVHNPHYYEYQRTRGTNQREIGDVQCGGLPNVNQVYRLTGSVAIIGRILQTITHFQLVEMPRFQNINLMNPNRNLEWRVKYMLNEISESDFKQKIQQVDKDLNKRMEIGQVSTTFVQVATDLFSQLMDTRKTDKFLDEYNYAISYFNGLFQEISVSYGCSVPYISSDYYISIRNHQFMKALPSTAGPSVA